MVVFTHLPSSSGWVWNQPFEPPFAQRMPPHPAELGDAEL